MKLHARARALAAAWALAAVLTACGSDADGDGERAAAGTDEVTTASTAQGGTRAAAPDAAIEGTVTVFAAASLTDAFEEVAAAFEAGNREVTVELSFASSSTLREQILAGAPADVFASANQSNVEELVEAGAATGAADFVENELQIVVPAGNPGAVKGLADLADDDLLVGLCAQEVPCGQLGREALAKAGVTPSIDTDEPDVRSLLTKVGAGELDVGLVYRTDVLAAGEAVEGIDLAPDQEVTTTYPITTLTDGGNPEAGAAFVAFVLSARGQEILASYGFDPP
ncbi:MAG: Molybdenum ABC transporter, substrate-binding protein ModA [uncultured Acidimicrobiales bacterium]|uniref:Molybdenum ABC transporter, substrate-binding protein ModA n=1 Tax=uncultured Acidimicrobiales bacterium TaxID=310071 RepID=A0A6J4H9K2_9ACTN|nr:MAG: Molybdenum ABC transporter, substrate-binding protein ModA [uncultured Acidimicrobiales bacterium]